MSNALYDAIIILGRSARDAANGGWICGMLSEGGDTGPKCVNGLLTWHLGPNRLGVQEPLYITNDDLTDAQREAALLAGRALLKTAPVEVDDYLVPFTDKEIDLMSAGSVENRLVEINDAETDENIPVLNSVLAAAWFNRALDLLAQQLPDPDVLTVNEIVATPIETVEEGAPDPVVL